MIPSPANPVNARSSGRPLTAGLLVLATLAAGCSLAGRTERSSRATPSPTPLVDVRSVAAAPTPAPEPATPEPAQEPTVEVVDATVPLEPTVVEATVVEESAVEATVVTEPVTTTPPAAIASRPPVRSEGRPRVEPAPPVDPGQRAIDILEAAIRTDWPLLRANALEAMSADPARLRAAVMASLNDPNLGVRFVATMLVGTADLCDLAPLVEPLLEDPSDSVRAAAIYALATCSDPVNPTPLAAMVASDNPEVRANAYVVLGLLGEPSAIPLIRSGIGQGMGLVDPVRARLVDLQGAAALVRLGDEREIEPIRAALFAPTEQAELTALAIQLVSRLHDEGARQMLVRLVEAPSRESRPPEIRLAAAEAIAVLGAREPEPFLRLAGEYVDSPRAEIRAQVASLLGEVADPAAQTLLSNLMADPDPVVRVAAAGSWLNLTVDERTAAAPVH